MSVLAAHFLSRLPIDGQAILLPFHGSCERNEGWDFQLAKLVFFILYTYI